MGRIKQMSKERNKALEEVKQDLQKVKDILGNLDLESITNLLDSSVSSMAGIAEELQETLDDMSDKKREGDKAQRMDEIAEKLSGASSIIADMLSDLSSCLTQSTETLDEQMTALDECMED
jgi:ABC-type transporter Mla subunit MlaD